jgi:hypothetical protein
MLHTSGMLTLRVMDSDLRRSLSRVRRLEAIPKLLNLLRLGFGLLSFSNEGLSQPLHLQHQ